MAAMSGGRNSSELSRFNPARNPTSMSRSGLCANVRRWQRPEQRHMRNTGAFPLVINRPVHLRAAAACVCYRTEKIVLSQ